MTAASPSENLTSLGLGAASWSIERLAELQSTLDGELRFDSISRKLYSTDASAYQETPLAVAIPKSEPDIKLLIEFANRHAVGLIPRTAGTSLAGQVVGDGIDVDVSRYFTRILEVNQQEGWVRVQPGVIRDELNMELAKFGLMFGPETSTSNRAMIGGMVGNNSCGSNSIVYGSTRDHTLELRGFLSDGSEATFGAISDEEFAAKCQSQEPLESAIYRGISEMLSKPANRDEIHREFPKLEIKRRNTGYAIDLLASTSPFADALTSESSERPSDPANSFNFCKLLAGSEGTLFFTTEIKLRCLPLPPPVSGLLCIHFESVDEALRATQIAVGINPFACELIDRLVLQGAARNIEQRENASFVFGDPGAILVVEFRGQSESEVASAAKRLKKELRSARLGYHFPILFGAEASKAWNLRKAGLGVVGNIPGDTKPCAVIEDTAVAVEDLPEFIAEFNQILNDNYGLACVHYAHAGAGEIHLRPILNLKTADGNEQFRDVASDIADLVKRYRGSLSGEHGDGRLRAEFLERMVGSKNFAMLKDVKRLWDPNGIFNPGKIVEAPPMNEQLRYQPGQTTPEIETVFDFRHEQGVVRAAELCNGSGDCRKTHLSGGTMCPSYMATKDEADSTRARANMLRHVLTNPTDKAQPFNSKELKQVMDLCLSCKGCKRECPSNVDVAKMKAEFLQGYYDANGVPRRAKLIAGFARQMQLASKLPRLFNFIASNSITSSILKRYAGFATQRTIPKLHSTTLRSWFDKHQPHANAGKLGKVILFCDEFTNYNDTPIGIASVELLERLGYQIEMPKHEESGRAAMSKGLLRDARKIAQANVALLAPLISAETPLVGIEPSAILSFRDEYPVLVGAGHKERAMAIGSNCLMVDELIAKAIDADQINARMFHDESRVIRLHGHCHQKALSSLAATVRMLQLPANYTVRLIPSGCCGMAGSFGYEKEHYEISMQIGELVLFPAVRNESLDVLIAAPGTSCRHQIADGTGRRALHPVEILRAALQE